MNMTKTDQTNKLLSLFAEAFEGRDTGDSPHIADDENLLARWSRGLVDTAEHQEIVRHLADCSDCRELVALMVDNGALVLPPAPAEPVSRRRSVQIAALTIVAIAATVLVAMFLPGVLPGPNTRLGQSLALSAFDFQLDGRSYGMALKVPPDEVLRDWESKINQRPDDVRLRLQYGRFMLEYNRPDEAAIQFDAVLELEPNNTDALIGKGVAIYEREYNANSVDFEPALRLFRQALGRDPDDFAAHLNAAIVLDRLGREDEAAEHWRRADRLASDEKTKRSVGEHLRERQIEVP